MNANQYFYVLIPSIFLCQILVYSIFPRLNSSAGISLKESLALTYASYALILINSSMYKRVKSQNAVKYLLPLTEEVFKIIIAVFCPAADLLHGFWLSFGTPSIYIEYSPRNYDEYYSEFLGAYRAFASHEKLNLASKKSFAYSHLKREVDSDSENLTLTSEVSDISKKKSLKLFPTTIEPLAPGAKRSKSISIFDDEFSFDQHHGLIDKLYSVSPKDTYHLDEETVNACIMQNESIRESISNNSENAIERDPLINKMDLEDPLFPSDVTASNTYKEMGTHFGGGGGGGLQLDLPGNSRLSFGGGGGFNYEHSCHESQESAISGKLLKYIDWLIPISMLIKRRVHKDNSDNSHLIRKKLSYYTLNSTKDEESSYGGDIQADDESDKYVQFEKYVAAYFDISGNGKGFPIDPIFKKYNVLLVDISTKYVFMDLMDFILWNFTTFLIISLIYVDRKAFFFLYPNCIVLKYFKNNFLRTEMKNYKARLLLYLLIDVLCSISLYIYVSFLYSN